VLEKLRGERVKLEKGLVQIYHGTGKGKSTAAFGLAFRAAGQGLKVCVIQFMKATVEEAGEVKTAAMIDNIEVYRFGRSFIERPRPTNDEIIQRINEGLEFAERAVSSGKYSLVILDEINVALHLKVADVGDVIRVIKAKNPDVEMVLTGRYPPSGLIAVADLVTEMNMVKHPFEQGVKARKGIDY